MEAISPTVDPTPPVQPAPSSIPPRDASPPAARPWAALLLIAALIGFYAPVLAANMRHAAEPLRFNDDARQQIWPFLRDYDARLFHTDLIADYYLACTPAAYKLLYATAARWFDPRSFSKVLPYLLLAITVAAAARAAGRLEGKWAAWGTAALFLGAPVFLERMGGGLPRSFAFPLYALAALALVAGRPIVLAAVVVIAAGFYPTAAVTSGIALAAMLLLLPARQRGAAARWGLGRRLMLTAATAVLAALLVWPTQHASSVYGSILRPSDAAEYPEVGPGGRYVDEDRAPALFGRADLAEYVRATLSGLGGPGGAGQSLFARPGRKIPLWIFAALGAVGTATLLVRDVRTRRLLLLAAAALLAHVVSIPLSPYFYLPERYLAYPLPVVAAILVPAGIAALPLRFARASHSQSARGPTVLAICGAYLLFLFFTEGRGVKTAGLDYVVSGHEATYAFLRDKTPVYAMVAGWPSEMNDIPYVCERPVLVSRETHQAFHRNFANKMRGRVDAVIGALYAPDRSGLERLRDIFGVNYLIVSSKLYSQSPPHYFAPFDDRAADARRALGDTPADVAREINRFAVLKDGDWTLLDLGMLPVKVDRPKTKPTSILPAP
jgi:hypothetical protein